MATCLAACGRRADVQMHNDLKLIALAYHSFHEKHRRGPETLEEFRPFVGQPDIERKLADGTYVFRYGIGLRDMNEHGTSKTILAYHKDVPSKGGPAIMGDGSLYLLEPGEYDSFPPPPKRN